MAFGARAALLGAAAAAALTGLAGCAGMMTATSSPNLAVTAAAQSLRTGAQVRLSATDPATGRPAAVRWTITDSDNASALGPGTIDATGVYTAPGALSADAVDVTLTATSTAGPAESSSTTLTLTPGFAQPAAPENAAVSPGEQIEITARLAEVDAGSVTWSLRTLPGAPATPQHLLGTLAPAACARAPREFTACTVTYTAPPASTPTPGPAAVEIVAAVGNPIAGGAPGASTSVRVLLTGRDLASDPTAHRALQSGPILLGSSGSNDNDFDTFTDAGGGAGAGNAGGSYIADCCGGTLGALVQDRTGQQYILSNNHVLAESDQGHAGDAIVQPGTIDDGCVPLSSPGARLRPVGALGAAVPLDAPDTNVDAALAAVAPGAVDASGAIEELGPSGRLAWGTGSGSGAGLPSRAGSSLPAAPPTAGRGEVLTAASLAGIEVVKSGRTTGLTCSTVSAVDLAVKVDYFRDCAETQPYTTRIFTGQIGIPGNHFSDAGDSGALVLDAANAQPLGLFFAESTSTDATDNPGDRGLSIANPIGDVLTALGAELGTSLTIAGSPVPHRVACLDYDGLADGAGDTPAPGPIASRAGSDPGQMSGAIDRASAGTPAAQPAFAALSEAERDRAEAATRSAQSLVSAEKGVLGVAPGASADAPGEAAVLVYVDRYLQAGRIFGPRPQPAGGAAAQAGTGPSVPPTIDGVRTVVLPIDALTLALGAAPGTASAREGIRLPQSALSQAAAAVHALTDHLLADPAVFGLGVTESLDDPREAALLVLLDSSRPPPDVLTASQQKTSGTAGADQEQDSRLPATLAGFRVRYEQMHPFHVTRGKGVQPGAQQGRCSLRAPDGSSGSGTGNNAWSGQAAVQGVLRLGSRR